MALGMGLRTLLQEFAQREAMSAKEVEASLARIGSEVDGAEGQQRNVDACITSINKYLKCMDLEIRGYHAGSSQRMFALINLKNDDVAKTEGGKLNAVEASLFRTILHALASSVEYTATVGELERHRGKLTAAKFEIFLKDLVSHQWLTADDDDDEENDYGVTFGPRAYTELADHLRSLEVNVPQQIVLSK